MDACQVEGCTRTVSKAGYELCLDHWKAERGGEVVRCKSCDAWIDRRVAVPHVCPVPVADDEDGIGFLSSTKLGKHFGLSNVKMNLILAELGWIERYVKGWVPTDHGNAMGAHVREMRNGTPFVVWPDLIVMNAALRASIEEQGGRVQRPASPAPPLRVTTPAATAPRTSPPPLPTAPPLACDRSADFRAKFPATFRTQDGPMVRSRAEVLIDNWLYMQGIVHAYERRLPIEAECYCDFYPPRGKGVYIEFWGRENDPKYRERMTVKQAIYAKHGLRLIELGDAEIERLDDVLPRMLLRFGIESA